MEDWFDKYSREMANAKKNHDERSDFSTMTDRFLFEQEMDSAFHEKFESLKQEMNALEKGNNQQCMEMDTMNQEKEDGTSITSQKVDLLHFCERIIPKSFLNETFTQLIFKIKRCNSLHL